MGLGTDITEEVNQMLTQLLAPGRLGSALRTLALALLLSGAVAPAALADHMGNHIRGGDSQSTDTTAVACGSEIAGSSSQPMRLVGDPAGGSDTETPAETMPAHPFTGRPW